MIKESVKKSKLQNLGKYAGNGPGRPKGSKNKFTKVKEDIVWAFEMAGAKHKLLDHLKSSNPKTFFQGLDSVIKVLPKEPQVQNITNIVSVDYGWTEEESEATLCPTDLSERDS